MPDAPVSCPLVGGEKTGADLRERSAEFLREHFGKSGEWYFRIARGVDHRPVEPHRARKSIGAEDTFSEDIFTIDPARREIAALSAKIWRSCTAKALTGRTVTLKVKYADFQQITRSRTMERAVRAAEDLTEIASGLLEPLFPPEKGAYGFLA